MTQVDTDDAAVEPEEAPTRRWRVFGLPVPVVAEGARARLVGGLLEVTLPLADPRGVRAPVFSLEVTSGE